MNLLATVGSVGSGSDKILVVLFYILCVIIVGLIATLIVKLAKRFLKNIKK